METDFASDQQLKADVDALREKFPNTSELYRELCALLFFRYNITPTGNKLYQLVRKGTMGTPIEALNKFWEQLREKSRVRIEHPDLPEPLKAAAGEMVATLWLSARDLATESFAAARDEANAAVASAERKLAAAESERALAQQDRERTLLAMEACDRKNRELEQQLAAAVATNSALDKQLHETTTALADLQERSESARQEKAAEIEQLRRALALAEERRQAAEARAAVDIEREKKEAALLREELAMTRGTAEQTAARMQSELSNLHRQIGDLRENAGHLEGRVQAMATANMQLESTLQTMRTQIGETEAALVEARTELSQDRAKILELERSLAKAKAALKPPGAKRKPPVT